MTLLDLDFVRAQLRGADRGGLRKSLNGVEQRTKPSGLWKRVGVEEHEIGCRDPMCRGIVSFGEA